MSDSTSPPRSDPGRPLAGARGWVICDGRAGMIAQTRGVAEALGLDVEMKTLSPRGIYRLIAPWGPADPGLRIGEPGSLLAPPWPTVVIATGRASIPPLRAVKRRAGAAVFTVVLLDARAGNRVADLVWVPQHDRLRGANVVTTLAAPHPFSPARLAGLRASMPADIAALPVPRVAVVLGGRNGSYAFNAQDDARLARSLRAIVELGAGLMITTSRRTHRALLDTVETATRGAPRIMWTGAGDNPYAQFLAHADGVVVTADSVNMTGEACVTGRPVYVFDPSGGAAKFHSFHASLRAYGATRPLPEQLAAWQPWTYAPLFSADVIAREIELRWSRRAAMLPGLVGRRAGS